LEKYARSEWPGFANHAFVHAGRKVALRCEIGTRVGQCLARGRFYEHRMLGYITRVAKAGVFIDVGANCGHHTLYFALFAPSTKVCAFEPPPEHVALIRHNVAANALEAKVAVMPFGAAETYRAFRMETNAALFPAQITGQCLPVDDYVEGPVSVLKVDVEGMELEALKDARRILAAHKPRVFVECLDASKLDAVLAFLAAFGYRRGEVDIGLALTHEFL
jgi:FkbM family methyltransferase